MEGNSFCLSTGRPHLHFGFSRGAFAARHLASMIVRRGLKGWRGSLEEEYREWLTAVRQPCTVVQQRIHMLGLFDCVPGNQFYVLRDRSSHLNIGELEPGIDHFRHAVSIHERRWSFKPIFFRDTGSQSFKQCWFPGYHNDVGGGPGCAEGLAAYSLWWMMREAHGLELNLNHVVCRDHRAGNTLNVIQAVDTLDPPKCSDWITTRCGFAVDRSKLPGAEYVTPAPDFMDLDECYRCGNEMYDALATPDAHRRFARVRGSSGGEGTRAD
ncbi:DUF2235 domain-containing protein [Paraburkholderia guartelaensis]|uniref:DUF2235 domain-containing protein n=1 Tax=Paraburkholderia guartelaensis TaxID=2546446 RepID=A0A4R5L5H3_9BURK|nr:DUF2235 domain-containing protein [Paraburkholderia guartelaensis]